MTYRIEYTDKSDRLDKITEQERLGRELLHDDITPAGGIMTFIDPLPPTPEEIAEWDERIAFGRADLLIDAITNLSEAKLFLKRLCARLIKKGLLP